MKIYRNGINNSVQIFLLFLPLSFFLSFSLFLSRSFAVLLLGERFIEMRGLFYCFWGMAFHCFGTLANDSGHNRSLKRSTIIKSSHKPSSSSCCCSAFLLPRVRTGEKATNQDWLILFFAMLEVVRCSCKRELLYLSFNIKCLLYKAFGDVLLEDVSKLQKSQIKYIISLKVFSSFKWMVSFLIHLVDLLMVFVLQFVYISSTQSYGFFLICFLIL